MIGARAAAAKARAQADGSAPADEVAAEDLSGLAGVRHRLRTSRRLRVVTLLSLAVIVLIVLPAIFGLRAAGKDPVFGSLDSLDVPSWASTDVVDQSSGSQWCFLDCTFRERIVQSDKPFKETAEAYSAALTSAGWRPWKVADCPEQPVEGNYSCWRRDELTLDLWARLPECAVDQVAAQDPAALPSDAPQPTAGQKCEGSTVSIKVQEAIADPRGKPEPKQDPGMVGETPDPVLSDDPLLEPTPTAS